MAEAALLSFDDVANGFSWWVVQFQKVVSVLLAYGAVCL
jgi:hypothetical protein